MNILPAHLDALEALGYTEAEARFLYIVATHSGYFVARQFLTFTRAHWGYRTNTFWNKLHAQKHARTERFPKSGTIYHLFSRRLYRQIDRENIRNRREHEIEYIKRRIDMLDFVLLHPEWNYLKTEPEKVSFFCKALNVPSQFLPSKIYCGRKTSQPTVRHFVDKFPMFVAGGDSSKVVTFTYVQGQSTTLTDFARHLETYLPLFQQLAAFRFLYLARFDTHFEKARELFNALVTIPLGSDASAELLRYFDIRKAWELCRYASLTEADLIFRNQAQRRFSGQRFEHLYRTWKAGRIANAEVQKEFAGRSRPVSASFAAEVLSPASVPEQDSAEEG
jgi:hypothetical protein